MIINTAILIQEYTFRPTFSTVFAKLAFFAQTLHHYPTPNFQIRTIPRKSPHSCHMNALLVSHHIASSAISAVASYNGFVWLTLSIHA